MTLWRGDCCRTVCACGCVANVKPAAEQANHVDLAEEGSLLINQFDFERIVSRAQFPLLSNVRQFQVAPCEATCQETLLRLFETGAIPLPATKLKIGLRTGVFSEAQSRRCRSAASKALHSPDQRHRHLTNAPEIAIAASLGTAGGRSGDKNDCDHVRS